MQGQDPSLRHEIVHHTEQAFLHLPGVLRAEDYHFSSTKVDVYARRRRHVMRVAIARELTGIVYGEVWSAKMLQLLVCGSDAPASHRVVLHSSTQC